MDIFQCKISIHAPAKGATKPNLSGITLIIISIHAPAKGATVWKKSINFFSAYFNPRTREGCDPSCHIRFVRWAISIHAPAKGATISVELSYAKIFLFQSTHPRRVRQSQIKTSYHGPLISIHAPAKGATFQPMERRRKLDHFNPRTREGCDWL